MILGFDFLIGADIIITVVKPTMDEITTPCARKPTTSVVGS